MQIAKDSELFKAAVAYPPHEFVVVVYGPAEPIRLDLTADELSDLGWPVHVSSRDYSATVLTPYAIGGEA